MKSILEKLYYGEISPCSEPTPTTERYLEAKDDVERIGEKIIAKYPDCMELLECYADALHITAACESLQDFERGFRLGAQLMSGLSCICRRDRAICTGFQSHLAGRREPLRRTVEP